MTHDNAKLANLKEFFEGNDQDSLIGKRIKRMVETSERVEKPSFPRQVQIETSNVCNHHCTFCAYTKMDRPRRHMDRDMFKRLVQEAYDCGGREIGLFAGAEPLTCKWLEEYIELCSDIGYEYMYISTNGALADTDRFKRLMDAGLNSVKFSVNGGTREVYKDIHKRDDFDKVIENIKFVSEYRKNLDRPFYLGISFVGMEHSRHTYQTLVDMMSSVVDKIIYYEASNQSGQMDDLPLPPYSDCSLPFNKIHISLEGYVKACCNDYENLLAIEDTKEMPLMEAWHSERFQKLRRAHIDNDMEGTLCAKCIRASSCTAKPINDALYDTSHKRPERKTRKYA